MNYYVLIVVFCFNYMNAASCRTEQMPQIYHTEKECIDSGSAIPGRPTRPYHEKDDFICLSVLTPSQHW